MNKLLLCAVALTCMAHGIDAFGQTPTYVAEIGVYLVKDSPIRIYSTERPLPRNSAVIEAKLDKTVSLLFEDIHVSEVFDFLTHVYEIGFVVDDGLIAPRGQDASGYKSSGRVEYIELRDVPLRSALIAILTPLGLSYAPENETIHVVDRAGESSAAKTDREKRTTYSPSNAWEIVERGQIRVGETLIDLMDAEISALDSSAGMERLGHPVITVREGEPASVRIGGYVEYLVEAADAPGRYELRHTDDSMGLSVEFELNRSGSSELDCDLNLNYAYVAKRQVLTGTSLEAGEPTFVSAKWKANVSLTPGRPIAMLTDSGTGDGGALLALLNVKRVTDANASMFQSYMVETRFIQVRGEPNWSWWTQPFGSPHKIENGARGVLGPVAITHEQGETANRYEWLETAFRKISELTFLSAPRVTGFLDHRDMFENKKIPTAMKIVFSSSLHPPLPDSVTPMTDASKRSQGGINLGELLIPLYDSLAIVPGTLGPNELTGRAVITNAQVLRDQERTMAPLPGQGKGVMLIVGADSADDADVYKLELTALIRELLYERGWFQTKPGNDIVHAQFRCDYEVADGSTSAFMVPVDDKTLLVVAVEFKTVPPSEN